MLYISPEQFYKQIAENIKLSREEEIECAIEGKPSMKLIYQGILVLEDWF